MVTTIGSLANVPNPGSPVTSPWAQDATRLVRHVFANKAALDAAVWPGLADGAQAYTLAEQLEWDRVGGVWRAADVYRLLGRTRATVAVPGIGSGGAGIAPAIATVVPAGGRILEIRARVNLSAAAGVGAFSVATLDGAVQSPRLDQLNDIRTGAILDGRVLVFAAAGNRSAGANVAPTGAGLITLENAADVAVLELYDRGPGPLPALLEGEAEGEAEG